MSIAGIRAGIKTRLATISGLRIYEYPPDSVSEIPAAMILPKSGKYNLTMKNTAMEYEFELTLLVSRAVDVSNAQECIDDYINPSGAKSIQVAIEGDSTLNGAADTSWLIGFRDYGGFLYAGQTYLGCKFDLAVRDLGG
jgi:hypothetical protein